MTQLSWKQFLLFFVFVTLLVVTVVAVNVDRACYGDETTIDCSQHLLQCQERNIFITRAFRGFKPTSNWCNVKRPSCWNVDSCCRFQTNDYLEYYTWVAFSALAEQCWNKQSCRYTVPYANMFINSPDHKAGSGYSEVQYLCLPDWAIHDFSDSNTMTASSLALRYFTSSDTGSYVCLVEAEDGSQGTAGVMLVKIPNIYYFWDCLSLRVNNETWLPCSTSIRYARYTLTTPFCVWLKIVNNNDVSQAWAVIHATDSSTLRVNCKPWTSDVPFPQCSSKATPTTMASTSAPPTSPKTDPPTRPGTSMPSAFASSHSTGSSDTSAADVTSSTTSSVASGSSPDVTGGTMPQSADNTGSTASMVGGVVGAVLVVLLVVVLVVTLVFLRRRTPTGKTFSKVVTWIKGGNSSNPPYGNSPTAKTSESGRAVPHVTPDQPTSLPAYDNSMAAITDEAASDYNHLHQKPTSSSPHDVTYGHLADGSDVTDYGYDHVTKGKPAVRSGDVINNVYNTAGPATGAPSDEDFYNVAGAAKNWPDVINNVYNTPSPATEASSDGHYYNVTGLPQIRRDVIDSMYDTPKPAAAPGPDVTDNDAGSPYELARAVK